MNDSLPPAERAQTALRNAGRRGTGIAFAVMITVLLVALLFAANQNDIIGWILVVIAAGWLLLATVMVMTLRRGARKFGDAVDSARAGAASRHTEGSGAAVVVDEDTQARNLKLDHSFKIIQVQTRVIQQEMDKADDADTEVITRSLETMQMTAHNGRDMLADQVGRQKRSNGPDHGGTISGDVVQ